MGIDRQFLSTRTSIIPGRIDVKVYERDRGDKWLEPFVVKAEKRQQFAKPASADAVNPNGIPMTLTFFVFNLIELNGKTLNEGDIIQDVEKNEFWAIANSKDNILGQRVHCPVIASTDPIIE